MKIKGVRTVDIEISTEEMNRIATEALCKLFGWNSEWYIENGKVCDDKVYATSHSWVGSAPIRDATQQDEFVFKTIKQLRTATK
jgi:hypothetical protein